MSHFVFIPSGQASFRELVNDFAGGKGRVKKSSDTTVAVKPFKGVPPGSPSPPVPAAMGVPRAVALEAAAASPAKSNSNTAAGGKVATSGLKEAPKSITAVPSPVGVAKATRPVGRPKKAAAPPPVAAPRKGTALELAIVPPPAAAPKAPTRAVGRPPRMNRKTAVSAPKSTGKSSTKMKAGVTSNALKAKTAVKKPRSGEFGRLVKCL